LRGQKVTLLDAEGNPCDDVLVLSSSADELLPDIPELLPTMIVEVIEGPSEVGDVEIDS
jgi:hypothetical protein